MERAEPERHHPPDPQRVPDVSGRRAADHWLTEHSISNPIAVGHSALLIIQR